LKVLVVNVIVFWKY